MIFPKGGVGGLGAILASSHHGAIARYEARNPQQDGVKIREFYDITIIRPYWTLYTTMKGSREYTMNKERGAWIYRSYPQGEKLMHVRYSGLP